MLHQSICTHSSLIDVSKWFFSSACVFKEYVPSRETAVYLYRPDSAGSKKLILGPVLKAHFSVFALCAQGRPFYYLLGICTKPASSQKSMHSTGKLVGVLRAESIVYPGLQEPPGDR